MLAPISKLFRGRVRLVALSAAAATFISCAHEAPQQLVSDPSAGKRESALPWNEQTQWERSGPYGAMIGEQERR